MINGIITVDPNQQGYLKMLFTFGDCNVIEYVIKRAKYF